MQLCEKVRIAKNGHVERVVSFYMPIFDYKNIFHLTEISRIE